MVLVGLVTEHILITVQWDTHFLSHSSKNSIQCDDVKKYSKSMNISPTEFIICLLSKNIENKEMTPHCYHVFQDTGITILAMNLATYKFSVINENQFTTLHS